MKRDLVQALPFQFVQLLDQIDAQAAALKGLNGLLEQAWFPSLDAAAARKPNPGRKDTFHRLNRTEYANIVRDVLGLEMDFSELLPIDDSGGGNASRSGRQACWQVTF